MKKIYNLVAVVFFVLLPSLQACESVETDGVAASETSKEVYVGTLMEVYRDGDFLDPSSVKTTNFTAGLYVKEKNCEDGSRELDLDLRAIDPGDGLAYPWWHWYGIQIDEDGVFYFDDGDPYFNMILYGIAVGDAIHLTIGLDIQRDETYHEVYEYHGFKLSKDKAKEWEAAKLGYYPPYPPESDDECSGTPTRHSPQ
jgi:hypothetical protein